MVQINGVSGVNFESDYFTGGGTSGIGIDFKGLPGSADYAIYYNISKSQFLAMNLAVIYDTYSQGLTISQTNFQNLQTGVYVPPGTVGLAQLNILGGNQFATYADAVHVEGAVADITIIGNDLYAPTGFSAINLLQSAGFAIVGNTITGQDATTTIGIAAANTLNGVAGTISGNKLHALGTGVVLTSTANHVTMSGNGYSANLVNGTNAGSLMAPLLRGPTFRSNTIMAAA